MRVRATTAALVAAVTCVVSGCGSDAATGDKGYVAGDGVISVLGPGERKAPGPIQGSTLQGDRLDVADLTGKPVVINVWASWCAPCRAESPVLKQAAEELEGKAEFVGINVRDPSAKDRALAFERTFELPYPSLYDPSGRSLLAFHGKVTPYTIPSTVVLDSKGRVAGSIIGEVPSATTLTSMIEDIDAGANTNTNTDTGTDSDSGTGAGS